MFNERLRNLRKSRGISQVELAKCLGVTKQSVSNWENDNIQPSIEMLVKIAMFFNVTSDYLLSIDDRKFIEVSGISDSAIEHIKLIINDIKQK
ncbi:MAG: helix-turn-helix transcriptional regulator [Clostridia bacterium]|nr:helix-turn-helix transcriptional regulator [Clostridia bacterium]